MVATANRREGVYNRAGEPSVTFCGKGGAVKQTNTPPFRWGNVSGACSDVAYPGGFEPLAFGVGVQRSIQLSYGYIYIDEIFNNFCEFLTLRVLSLHCVKKISCCKRMIAKHLTNGIIILTIPTIFIMVKCRANFIHRLL